MKKEKLRKIPHLISAFIILIHSLERFESGHKSYLIFLLAGIVFLCVAIFHKILSNNFCLTDLTFYGIESILSFTIAYEYWIAGKNGLPIAYILAGIFQIIAIYIFKVKSKSRKAGTNLSQ